MGRRKNIFVRFVILLIVLFFAFLSAYEEKGKTNNYYKKENEGQSIRVERISMNTIELSDEEKKTIENTEIDNNEFIIRVVIKDNDFESIYHSSLQIENGNGEIWNSLDAGNSSEEILILENPGGDRLHIKNLKRNEDFGGYRGKLEIRMEEQGYVVINELPLEEYLYGVVPGEMPSAYPMEALKAQAICARSFAFDKILHPGYEEYDANLDDSTSYQVYGTKAENERTNNAVDETEGMLCLNSEGELIETQYYSTSMGNGRRQVLKNSLLNSREIWNTYLENLKSEEVFREYIMTRDDNDLEAGERLYRWKAEYKSENLAQELYQRLKCEKSVKGDQLKKFKIIDSIQVDEREEGGVVKKIQIHTDKGIYLLEGEASCRRVLCLPQMVILDQFGQEFSGLKILPSGFFAIDCSTKNNSVIGYTLCGGGFGHGRGMSQNGAKALAQLGYTCEQILDFFYR